MVDGSEDDYGDELLDRSGKYTTPIARRQDFRACANEYMYVGLYESASKLLVHAAYVFELACSLSFSEEFA